MGQHDSVKAHHHSEVHRRHVSATTLRLSTDGARLSDARGPGCGLSASASKIFCRSSRPRADPRRYPCRRAYVIAVPEEPRNRRRPIFGCNSRKTPDRASTKAAGHRNAMGANPTTGRLRPPVRLAPKRRTVEAVSAVGIYVALTGKADPTSQNPRRLIAKGHVFSQLQSAPDKERPQGSHEWSGAHVKHEAT